MNVWVGTVAVILTVVVLIAVRVLWLVVSSYRTGEIKQVYIVTAGEYSDYSICSVWLTLKEAKAQVGDSGSRIEVWPVGTFKRTLGGFRQSGDFDAATGQILDESSYDGPDLEPARADVLCWASTSKIGIRVTQETQERAAKIYGELRTRVLASISRGVPPEAIASFQYKNGSWSNTGSASA